MLFKYCGRCKKLKAVTEFNKGGYDGYDSYCKECRNKIAKNYYKNKKSSLQILKSII